MNGFQAPSGFNFGGNYSAPSTMAPVDYGLDLSRFGSSAPGVSFSPTAMSQFGNIPASAPGGSGLFDNFLSSTKDGVTTQGWGTPALGVASGLMNAFMGMKQYGLAKDSLAEGKRQFGLNYEAQKTTTNAQLEDRQRARVASNAGAYQSVGDYMSTYGIKG
jgi:hypothetical protein